MCGVFRADHATLDKAEILIFLLDGFAAEDAFVEFWPETNQIEQFENKYVNILKFENYQFQKALE